MSQIINLVGAFGRKYITKELAIMDWKAGKDFKVFGGAYCSIRDKDSLTRIAETVQLFTTLGETVNIKDIK